MEGECQELNTGHGKFEISVRWLGGGALLPARYRRLEFRRKTPNKVINMEVICTRTDLTSQGLNRKQWHTQIRNMSGGLLTKGLLEVSV